MTKKGFDLVIIGGGPAGLTAAIYAARNELHTLLVERAFPGGLMAQAVNIENFPGFESISGYELSEKILNQAKKLGAIIETGTIIEISVDGSERILTFEDGGKLSTKAVIIAGGSQRRKLGVPGEEEFLGRGVSYCATCDGAFYKEKTVAMIGGGNSALSEALHLADLCKKVYLIHRKDAFKGMVSLQSRVLANEKIEIKYHSEVREIKGETMVKEILLFNNQTNTNSRLPVDGVFISIGLVPQSNYYSKLLDTDRNGAIIVNANMQTNIPGVYAIGDIRSNSILQAISAAGDGAIAAYHATNYIGNNCPTC